MRQELSAKSNDYPTRTKLATLITALDTSIISKLVICYELNLSNTVANAYMPSAIAAPRITLSFYSINNI